MNWERSGRIADAAGRAQAVGWRSAIEQRMRRAVQGVTKVCNGSQLTQGVNRLGDGVNGWWSVACH